MGWQSEQHPHWKAGKPALGGVEVAGAGLVWEREASTWNGSLSSIPGHEAQQGDFVGVDPRRRNLYQHLHRGGR